MGYIGSIRRAVVDRIGPIDGISGYAFVKDVANVPCYMIRVDPNWAKFQVMSFGVIGISEVNLSITFYTNRLDEESAQEAIDDFFDPRGPMFTNLLSTNTPTGPIDDDLSRLVSYVEFGSGDQYGMHAVGGTHYWGARAPFIATTNL